MTAAEEREVIAFLAGVTTGVVLVAFGIVVGTYMYLAIGCGSLNPFCGLR